LIFYQKTIIYYIENPYEGRFTTPDHDVIIHFRVNTAQYSYECVKKKNEPCRHILYTQNTVCKRVLRRKLYVRHNRNRSVGIYNRIVPSAKEITLDRKRSSASKIILKGRLQQDLALFEVFVRLPTTWQ
jgi:hypothetical protein